MNRTSMPPIIIRNRIYENHDVFDINAIIILHVIVVVKIKIVIDNGCFMNMNIILIVIVIMIRVDSVISENSLIEY